MSFMRRASFLLALATGLAACVPSRPGSGEAPAAAASPAEPVPAPAPTPDARAAYETRGFSSAPTDLELWAGARLLGGGRVLAKPLILSAGGGEVLVAALEAGRLAELLAIGADSSVRATCELDERPLEAASWNDMALFSFSDGSIRAYALRASPEGGKEEVAAAEKGSAAELSREAPGELCLEMAWSREGMEAARLLVLPQGRVAALRADGGAACLEFATGERLWSFEDGEPIADCAYSPGLIVSCGTEGVSARSDSEGKPLWSKAGDPGSVSVASGGGRIAAIDSSGRLAIIDAAGGGLVAAAAGPFDPAIRPAIDSGMVYAALRGGGFACVEAASGRTTRTWERPRPSSFLLLDEDGILGSSGPFLIGCARYAEDDAGELRLPADPLGAPLLASDGSFRALPCSLGIVIAPALPPALDAAFAPKPAVAAAIAGALAGFGGNWPGSRPLRYGDFTQGLPIHPAEAVAVLLFDADRGGRRKLAASPDPGGAMIAIFDEEGRLLASGVDELGARAELDFAFAQGRRYYLVAGGRSADSGIGFRLLLR